MIDARVWSVIIVTFLSASSAAALEPTDAQMALNAEAVEAASRADYESAIEKYERSLEMGELNVIYLNLGRTLFKAGECDEAWQAYARAEDAPAATEPPPEAVAQILKRYRADILTECPATLVTTCTGDETTVSVGDDALQPCGLAWTGAPGEYAVTAHRGSANETKIARLRAGEEVALNFELPPPASPRRLGLRSLEWVAVGGVLLAGGLVLDGVVFRNFPAWSWNLQTDAGDFVGPGLYALSAGAFVLAWLARSP